MTLLLDSTILIDVLCSRPKQIDLVANWAMAGHTLSTSVVNAAEVYAGMRLGEEDRTRAFLEGLACLPVTESIAERAGILKNSWARRGKTLSLIDTIVAATALEYGLVLVTDNRKDFPMPELEFFPLG
jgi:predicted nucleic acid-binding protein